MLGDIILWFKNKEYIYKFESAFLDLKIAISQFVCIHDYTTHTDLNSGVWKQCQKCGRIRIYNLM